MLWNRRYKLKIFPTKESGISEFEINDYKIQFEFTRRFGGAASDFGSISIFNPSYNFSHGTQRGSKIELWVGWGYGTEFQLLFDGQIINTLKEYYPPDEVVTIYMNRLFRLVDKAVPSKSIITAPQTLKSVLLDMVNNDLNMGLWYPKTAETFMSQSISPRSFDTNVRGTIQDLADEFKFYWNISGENVRVMPKDSKPDANNVVLNLSINNGLLGVPTIKISGLEVVSILQPVVQNGDTIQINSPAYTFGGDTDLYYNNLSNAGDNGKIISSLINPENRKIEDDPRFIWVQELIHSGDTRDNTWQTKYIGLHGNRQGGITAME